MIFESINYSHLLQDFIFSMGAGFAVGVINEAAAIFLPGGKKTQFFRDVFLCMLLSFVIFSYVISFTNYPIIRFYHLLGGILGFLSFPFKFSIFFHKIVKNFFIKLKNKILCLVNKAVSIICDHRQKRRQKKENQQKTAETEDLQSKEVWVYNL